MSIASEITRINTNIANAYTQCDSKGATMPQTQNSDNLSTTIASIPSGGGTINNQDKTITSNGIYTADSGYTGLGTVTVAVPKIVTFDNNKIIVDNSYNSQHYDTGITFSNKVTPLNLNIRFTINEIGASNIIALALTNSALKTAPIYGNNFNTSTNAKLNTVGYGGSMQNNNGACFAFRLNADGSVSRVYVSCFDSGGNIRQYCYNSNNNTIPSFNVGTENILSISSNGTITVNGNEMKPSSNAYYQTKFIKNFVQNSYVDYAYSPDTSSWYAGPVYTQNQTVDLFLPTSSEAGACLQLNTFHSFHHDGWAKNVGTIVSYLSFNGRYYVNVGSVTACTKNTSEVKSEILNVLDSTKYLSFGISGKGTNQNKFTINSITDGNGNVSLLENNINSITSIISQ